MLLPLWRTLWSFLKIQKELPYDLLILLLGIYLKKTNSQRFMYLYALFTIAKTKKQPKSPSTHEWIKKMCFMYIVKVT